MSSKNLRMHSRPASKGIYNRVVKRALDMLISALTLILLSPVILLSAILVKCTSKGPIIFRQQRIGKGAKEFTIYKFRTMQVGSEHTGSGVYSDDNDPRITGFGKILRKTSIDELPQLVNILKGDMALIGPRPPLTYHPWPVSDYSAEQLKMFDVRPGITGWAQIHGRKDVEWNKRIELNNWYVDHVSLPLDIRILFVTVGKVLTNADNENKSATASAPDENKKAV